MDIKKLIVLTVGLLAIRPLVKLTIFFFKNPLSPDTAHLWIQEPLNILVESVIPWIVTPLNWLSSSMFKFDNPIWQLFISMLIVFVVAVFAYTNDESLALQ